MDAKIGMTYDDGVVRRTVMEVNANRVRVISRWTTDRGDVASHPVTFTRQQWDEWFKGRKVRVTIEKQS